MQVIKRSVKRIIRRLYLNLVKPVLRPIHRRADHYLKASVQTSVSSVLVHGPYERLANSIGEIVQSNREFQKTIAETDRFMLATLKWPGEPTHSNKAAFAPVALGDGRMLLPHPFATYMFADASDRMGTPRLIVGSFEKCMFANLRRLVKPGHQVIEIGADQGFHTLSLSFLANAGRVTAIEDDAERVAVLRDNVATHHFTHVEVIHSTGTSYLAEALRTAKVDCDLVRVSFERADPAVLRPITELLAASHRTKLLIGFPRNSGQHISELVAMLDSAGCTARRVLTDGTMHPVGEQLEDECVLFAGRKGMH